MEAGLMKDMQVFHVFARAEADILAGNDAQAKKIFEESITSGDVILVIKVEPLIKTTR